MFTILSAIIEERAGLHYKPEDLELLRDKVSPRAIEAGFDSLLDYYYFLRYDRDGSAELDRLLEQLVVQETYFFREADQLEVLVDRLLRPAMDAGRNVRLWCAAAATGEEPLTLAMMFDARGLLGRVRILATDLSDRSLAGALRGEFSLRSARALPSGVLGRWLEKVGERMVARRELIEAIEWRRLNLVDEVAISALGSFDAVIARNVFIYFSDQTATRVVGNLARALLPGSYLLVGASESLLRYGTNLACEEHGGAFFYRRLR